MSHIFKVVNWGLDCPRLEGDRSRWHPNIARWLRCVCGPQGAPNHCSCREQPLSHQKTALFKKKLRTPRVFFSGEKYNKRVTSFYCLIIRVLYGLWGVGGCNCCFSLIMNVAVLLCSRTSSCPKATISIFTTAASQETSRASKVISRKFQLGGKNLPFAFPPFFCSGCIVAAAAIAHPSRIFTFLQSR